MLKQDDLHILIVDDNPIDREIYKRLISNQANSEYVFTEVESGDHGLQCCSLTKPDCILLDYNLPDKNGLEFLGELADKFGSIDTAVVMLTGQGNESVAVEAMKIGCQDYIPKSTISSRALHEAISGSMEKIRSKQEHEKKQEELQRLSSYDDLTGLMNRRAFIEQYDIEFKRALRFTHPLTLLMLDIDYFKNVNDSHGHSAGDMVLRTIAGTLQKSMRSFDVCGRYGGEEFIMVLPETEIQGGYILAERVRKNISKLSFPGSNGDVIKLTCSIGLATLDNNNYRVEQLIEAADEALYMAKNNGRNQVVTGSHAIKI
jgi:diguanylate cyclase (GGDEF)-like protein